MEQEPVMRIQFGDEGEFEAVPENTSLYRFVGALAIYNHVFFARSEDRGVYLFNTHEIYPQVEEYMVAAEYPIHDHLTGVPQCDLDAYDKMIGQYTGDLEDGVPESWT